MTMVERAAKAVWEKITNDTATDRQWMRFPKYMRQTYIEAAQAAIDTALSEKE